MNNSWKSKLAVSIVSTLAVSTNVWAASLPGEGVSVQPVQSSVAEETFQTLIAVSYTHLTLPTIYSV